MSSADFQPAVVDSEPFVFLYRRSGVPGELSSRSGSPSLSTSPQAKTVASGEPAGVSVGDQALEGERLPPWFKYSLACVPAMARSSFSSPFASAQAYA